MSIAAAEIYSNGACVTWCQSNGAARAYVYCRDRPCRFRILMQQDEDQWTVKTISPHDHGPAPELLCDSDWKPKTQNLDILEAIRQVEGNGRLDEHLRKLPASSTLSRFKRSLLG